MHARFLKRLNEGDKGAEALAAAIGWPLMLVDYAHDLDTGKEDRDTARIRAVAPLVGTVIAEQVVRRGEPVESALRSVQDAGVAVLQKTRPTISGGDADTIAIMKALCEELRIAPPTLA